MPHVKIFSDGSSFGNPGPGGAAAILICQNKIKEIYQGYLYTTNNRMELNACIIGLKALIFPGCNEPLAKVFHSKARRLMKNDKYSSVTY